MNKYVEATKNSNIKIMQVGITGEYIICQNSIMDSIAVSKDLIHWRINQSFENIVLADQDNIKSFRFNANFMEFYNEYMPTLKLEIVLSKNNNKVELKDLNNLIEQNEKFNLILVYDEESKMHLNRQLENILEQIN